MTVHGYSSRFELRELNAAWGMMDAVHGLVSLSIERDVSTELHESATAVVDSQTPEWEERYLRAYMVETGAGGAVRHELGTFLFSLNSATLDGGCWRLSLDGRSVLAPAADIDAPDGFSVAAGEDAAARVVKAFSECVKAPVSTSLAVAAPEAYVCSSGSSLSSAIQELAEKCGLSVLIDGHGRVTVGLPATEPAFVASIGNGLGFTGIELGTDTETDDDGNEVTYRTASYTREFNPAIECGSVIRFGLASLGLEGNARVVSQSLSVGEGLQTDEEVRFL